MATLLKFFPLAKVDEKTHTVSGVATSETPDAADEIADYPASKKAYAAWSSNFAKRTAAAGQETSHGNIRKQHSLEVAGKATAVHYDDAAKTVSLDTVPINDAMWEQIQKGFFTGFSHGGEYAWRQCNECETAIPEGNLCPSCKKQVYVRYAPILAEVSYVDNGCNPDATFTYVKADGTTEMRKFQGAAMDKGTAVIDPAELAKHVVAEMKKGEAKTKRVAGEDLPHTSFLIVGDKDDTSTWKLPVKFSTDEKTKSHIRNALARFDQLKGVSDEDKAAAKKKLDALAEKHGIDVADETEKVEKARVDLYNGIHKAMAGHLGKSMYTVSSLASMVESLAWMQRGVTSEEAYENDLESQLPEKLRENVEDLIETFLLMAEEETAELAAAMQEHKEMRMTTKSTVTKAAELSELSELKKQADELNEKIALLMKGEKKDKKDKDKALEIDDDGADGDGEPKSIDPIKNPELSGKSAITADMLKDALKQAREEGVSDFVKALTKAIEDDDDEHVTGCKCEDCKAAKAKKDKEKDKEKDKAEKVSKADDGKGIGDRTSAASTAGGPFFGSTPVTKVQDRGGESTASAALTPEVMEKAMNGDREAIAQLSKSAPAAASVPTTLQGLFAPR